MDLNQIKKKIKVKAQSNRAAVTEVKKTLKAKKGANVSYTNKRGETKTYALQPYATKLRGKKGSLVYCYDRKAGHVKAFNPKNIRSASMIRPDTISGFIDELKNNVVLRGAVK